MNPDPLTFDLEEATIADLQRRMATGQDTARSLVAKYLARIEALDRKGPALNQVLETNPDALALADALDAERRQRGPRGPLHGIPILIKDNIGTADRMATTAGSLALEGFTPPRDSFLAQRLREAGAILLGKTNMSEWANFRGRRSISGWSGRGGLGHNPYALDRSPSGSSSGSGAATAANFAAAAVGTETDGSIVSPATANSLVGIKPTLGLISRTGIIPIAHSQDTAGPMARTVADAAVLLSALVGADPEDAITAEGAAKGERDYTRFFARDGLEGTRLGVLRKGPMGSNPHADRIAEAAFAVMKDLGAVLVDPVEIPTHGQLGNGESTVMLYELKADMNAYLESVGASLRTLADLIAFNEEHREREMPFFGQERFLEAQEKGPLTDPEYLEALAKNRRLCGPEGIDAVMDAHRLDALVAPTGGPPGLVDLVNGNYGSGGGCSSFPAVAGYPHLTVPAGYAFGLPVGLSFIGRAYSEPVLIRLAYAFEQATRHRRPPRFLPTADVGPTRRR